MNGRKVVTNLSCCCGGLSCDLDPIRVTLAGLSAGGCGCLHTQVGTPSFYIRVLTQSDPNRVYNVVGQSGGTAPCEWYWTFDGVLSTYSGAEGCDGHTPEALIVFEVMLIGGEWHVCVFSGNPSSLLFYGHVPDGPAPIVIPNLYNSCSDARPFISFGTFFATFEGVSGYGGTATLTAP